MNLRLKITTLFFVLFSLCSFAQKESRIYDQKGRLIADTTFSISKLQLKRFIKIEDTLLYQIMINIRYPEIERETVISNDLIVVSFTIGKDDSIRGFKLEREHGHGDPGLVKEISSVLHRLQHLPALYAYNYSGIVSKRYYLAFRFLYDSPFNGSIIENGLIIEGCKPLRPTEHIEYNIGSIDDPVH